MKFYDEYIEYNGVMDTFIVPRLRVKFRDSLCFTGRKINYEDFTKFVLRDGVYLPLFYVGDVKDTDLVFDMHPLISIGASEMLAFDANTGDLSVRDFCLSLLDENIVSTKEKLKQIEEAVSSRDLVSNSNELLLLCAMRSDYITCSFPQIRNIVNMLTCATLTDKRLYAKAIIDVLKFSYKFVDVFTGGRPITRSITEVSENSLLAWLDGKTIKLGTSPKRIGYTAPNTSTKHYITNCRGLGIYAFLILSSCIFEKFGEPVSTKLSSKKHCVNEYKNKLQKCFNGCLGDDFIGKYYRNGSFNIKKYETSTAFQLILQNHVPMNAGTIYKLSDGSKVVRDIYEDEILFKRANKVSYNGVDGFMYRNSGTYYTVLDDILGCSYRCYVSAEEDTDEEERKRAKVYEKQFSEKYKHELDVLRTRLQDKHNNDLLELKEGHKKYCESYERKIEELNSIIASKSDIIEKTYQELKDCKAYMDSFFSEKEVNKSSTVVDVSLKEMVDYINEFKLTLVGGRSNTLAKLQAYGCSGVVQVDSETALNGTVQTTDFLCISTRFVAHKVVRLVESRYKFQKDQIFYYNGTSVEGIIKSFYEFIKKWMGE